MNVLLAAYLFALAAFLAAFVLKQHHDGRHELLSVRNVAIAGFILFQLTSGGYTLLSGDYGQYNLNHPTWIAFKFSVMATIFLAIALWAYDRGWGSVRLASKMPTTWAVPSDATLMLMSVVMLVLAAGFKFGVNVPLVGVLANYVGIGFASVSAGLVGWVWSRRMLNPAALLFGFSMLGVNFLVALAGSFGRRDLVAVGAGFLWGMYFSTWRHLPTGGLLRRLLTIGAIPVIVVALFTSVRGVAREQRSAAEQLQKILTLGDVGSGIVSLAQGQGCARVSMWLLETYPESIEYRHMHTILYFFFFPVPREMWENKPVPLSSLIARQARLTRLNRDAVTIGPGIIGHAGSEGGWYALVVYAIAGGLFLRFFDELLLNNIDRPLVVLPIGASLGQILGLARGETSPFAFTYVTAVAGALVTMLLIGRFMEGFGGRWTPVELEHNDEPADGWDAADPDDSPPPLDDFDDADHRPRPAFETS